METQFKGRISFNHISSSRGLRSFVEKYITRWILRQSLRGRVHYQVYFSREGEGHWVNCTVRVRGINEIWAGSELSQSPHQALVKSLRALRKAPYFSSMIHPHYPTALVPAMA